MTKSACSMLSDGELLQAGIPDTDTLRIFRAFLTLYDINSSKLRAVEKTSASESDKAALSELVKLPGVQLVRARLYLESGYGTLESIALSSPEEMIRRTAETIAIKNLQCSPPFTKEAATHIAVAGVLTAYAV